MNKDYWFYYFDNYYRWMNSYLNLLSSSGNYGEDLFETYIEDVSQFAPPISDKVYVERMFGDNGNWDNDNDKWDNDNDEWDDDDKWDNDNDEWDDDDKWDNSNKSNKNNPQSNNSNWDDISVKDYGFGSFENVGYTQLNLNDQKSFAPGSFNIFGKCKKYQILKVEAKKNNKTIKFMFIPISIAPNGFRGYILSCSNKGLSLIKITIPFTAIIKVSCVSL